MGLPDSLSVAAISKNHHKGIRMQKKRELLWKLPLDVTLGLFVNRSELSLLLFKSSQLFHQATFSTRGVVIVQDAFLSSFIQSTDSLRVAARCDFHITAFNCQTGFLDVGTGATAVTRLRTRRFSFCRIRLIADFVLAKSNLQNLGISKSIFNVIDIILHEYEHYGKGLASE